MDSVQWFKSSAGSTESKLMPCSTSQVEALSSFDYYYENLRHMPILSQNKTTRQKWTVWQNRHINQEDTEGL